MVIFHSYVSLPEGMIYRRTCNLNCRLRNDGCRNPDFHMVEAISSWSGRSHIFCQHMVTWSCDSSHGSVGWAGMVWTTFHVATNKIKKHWKACTRLQVNNGYMPILHVIQLPIFPAKLMKNHGRRDMAAIVEDSPLEHSDWSIPQQKHFDDTVNILFIYC